MSAPKHEGAFELLVRRCEPGVVSGALCGAAAGDTVELCGPFGFAVYGAYGASKLRLPASAFDGGGSGVVGAQHVVSLSAGSGIAPSVQLARAFGSALSLDSLPMLTLVHASRSEAHVPAVRRRCLDAGFRVYPASHVRACAVPRFVCASAGAWQVDAWRTGVGDGSRCVRGGVASSVPLGVP